MLYLDCAASTPLHPQVLQELSLAMEQDFANPSANHKAGRKCAQKVEKIRQEILRLLKAPADSTWVFTSGATESNNTLIKGLPLQEGNEIFFSSADHPSLVAPTQEWKQKGILAIEKNPSSKTRLALLSFVHPLTGKQLPVHELARQIKEKNPEAIVHVDAAQGFGKLPLEVGPIDSIAVSAHKLGGPKGIGGLYLKKSLARSLRPLLTGGGQQEGLRSSTIPSPLIQAFGRAVQVAMDNLESNLDSARQARQQLRDKLSKELPLLHFPFEEPDNSPYIFSFVHPNIPGEVLLRTLEEEGIIASSGPACSTRKRGPDPALNALGIPAQWHQHILRISFYPTLTKESEDLLVQSLKKADSKLGGLYA